MVRAEAAGYRVALRSFGQRAALADRMQMPDAQRTLGVICVGLMHEPSIKVYTDAGHPTICVDYWTTNRKADAIVVDCYSEGQDAVELLLRHGHRDLFYIGHALIAGHDVPQAESDAELLLSGMQRGLKLAGQAELSADRICFCASNEQAINVLTPAQVAEWFLSLRPRPTAGVIFNLYTGQLFVEHLKQHGLRCPEDVSLIVKGIEPPPANPFATLKSNPSLLGRLAVDALLDRLSGRRTTLLRMAVPSELVRGRTVRQMM